MTFLHKLARRLAGVPALGLLVIAAASCGQGDAQDYLGPDPHASTLISITISPRDPQVAFGDSVRFEANGWLSSGKSANAQVIWSASGGTITSNGWFRPSGIGSFEVRATSTVKTSLSDSVQVLSYNLVGGIQRLMVLPSGIAVPKGASQQFTAQAVLNDGSIVSPTVAWSAVGGTITSSGLFTATSSGTAQVTATLGAGMATAASDVAIQPAILTQLLLDPSSTAMESGESRQFTVAASWSDGSSTVPPVIWRVEGGTLSSQNVYTAGSTPGTYHVIVSSPSFAKADTTTVIVLPHLVSLSVSPDSARLAPGATQVLQAYALRNDGSQSAAGVQWSVTGGTIGLNGTYTAGAVAGQYRAIATLHAVNGQTFADSAQIVIGSPSATLTQLSVTPHATSIPVGNPLQFSVTGHWSDGSSTVPAVTWSATGGTIDASGLFTAGNTPGTYSIIARQTGGTRADTAQISVVAKLTDFRVSPKVDTLVAGTSHQFSAMLSWSDGQTHPVTIGWTTTGGAISSTGVYSPGSLVGSFLVIAACSCGASDTAAVSVLSPTPPASPVLTSLYVAPHSLALALGGVQQFSATGVWSDHSTGAVGVTYQATGGSISGSGFYVAGNVPGTYQIIATVQGGTKADTATITLSAGVVLSSMALSPPNAALLPGGSQHFGVSGLMSDGTSTTPAVSYSATGGTIDSQGNYTAGTQNGTYLVIASQQGGALVDTASVTIGSPTQLVMTPTAATVYPGTTRQFLVSGGNSLSFQATGGTITQAGLYTAGSAPGSYNVIVTSGTAADTSTVTIPALTSLSLSPNPATVGAGVGQLFSVTGQWSDGSNAAPLVNWTATGGTISPVGLYTAGSTTGTFSVTAQFSYGSQSATAPVTISGLAPPPPSGGELVAYPSPEVEFIIGPQLRSGSSSNPWPWFDENEAAKGLEHGANFPVTPLTDLDVFFNENYYDLGLCLYTEYYRTGNPLYLTYARKVEDSWWLQKPAIDEGRWTDFNSYDIGPRLSALGGLMLRALDGRPEMWPWITAFVNYDYDIWLGRWINNPELVQGVRDGGYMLLYTAQLAKVHPDPSVRAQFQAKALTAAREYYARLQYPDGGWYWKFDPEYVPQGGDMYASQPFMIGLLLEGMIATHQLTNDPVVAQAITRGADWLYNKAYERQLVTNLTGVRWRAMKYFVYRTNPAINDRTSGERYGTPDGAVRDERQLNSTTVHAFGYAFKLTGDTKYRDWGDDVFSADFGKGRGPGADAYWNLADFREKEYDQNYRAAGHYLVWRLGH